MKPTFLTAAMSSLALLLSSSVYADSLEKGVEALKQMTGCFLVDYSYSETEALKEGYVRDSRVYDVNKDKSVKEWIYLDKVTDTRFRLQHVMFLTDLNGKFKEGTELKHTGEDWEYQASFLYDFTGPLHWDVKTLSTSDDLWTRRITNLDDGLRYQCAAKWNFDLKYPEWNCGDNYAPIPGRETRDMGRKDYQTLVRNTRVIVYGDNWLERQSNTKTIHKDDVKTPLAKEVGKNWYVRLPNSECEPAKAFTKKLKPMWVATREAWDQVFTGKEPFVEVPPPQGKGPRFMAISKIEEEHASENFRNDSVKENFKSKVIEIIEQYRAR